MVKGCFVSRTSFLSNKTTHWACCLSRAFFFYSPCAPTNLGFWKYFLAYCVACCCDENQNYKKRKRKKKPTSLKPWTSQNRESFRAIGSMWISPQVLIPHVVSKVITLKVKKNILNYTKRNIVDQALFLLFKKKIYIWSCFSYASKYLNEWSLAVDFLLKDTT